MTQYKNPNQQAVVALISILQYIPLSHREGIRSNVQQENDLSLISFIFSFSFFLVNIRECLLFRIPERKKVKLILPHNL